MSSRLYVISNLFAQWGVGVILGALAGHDALYIGLGICILGQIGGRIFQYKRNY